MQAAMAKDAGNLNQAAALEAQAKSLEASQPGPWTKLMETLMGVGTQAYVAQQTSAAQIAASRAGVPLPSATPVAAMPYIPPSPEATASGGGNTLLYVGAALGIGLIAMMALR